MLLPSNLKINLPRFFNCSLFSLWTSATINQHHQSSLLPIRITSTNPFCYHWLPHGSPLTWWSQPQVGRLSGGSRQELPRRRYARSWRCCCARWRTLNARPRWPMSWSVPWPRWWDVVGWLMGLVGWRWLTLVCWLAGFVIGGYRSCWRWVWNMSWEAELQLIIMPT